MSEKNIHDRAYGAIMGFFIGDALALGPRWYCNLDDLRRDYGEWISTYTDPKPDRYYAGLKAGQLPQAGFILTLMIHSLVNRGGYDTDDFCRRLRRRAGPSGSMAYPGYRAFGQAEGISENRPIAISCRNAG